MAKQAEKQPKQKNKVSYGNVPEGSHMGFFKTGIAVQDAPITYSYSYIVAPSKEHMDLAVLNYIHKYGIREITSVTQEEYESKTQIQS